MQRQIARSIPCSLQAPAQSGWPAHALLGSKQRYLKKTAQPLLKVFLRTPGLSKKLSRISRPAHEPIAVV